MLRDFVVVDDGNEVPCIKYCKTTGPICCIELGSIVDVKIDDIDSVLGFLTDVTEEGIRIHVPSGEDGKVFAFVDIEDIILVSNPDAVKKTWDIMDGLAEIYGRYGLREILNGHRVDLDV